MQFKVRVCALVVQVNLDQVQLKQSVLVHHSAFKCASAPAAVAAICALSSACALLVQFQFNDQVQLKVRVCAMVVQ